MTLTCICAFKSRHQKHHDRDTLSSCHRYIKYMKLLHDTRARLHRFSTSRTQAPSHDVHETQRLLQRLWNMPNCRGSGCRPHRTLIVNAGGRGPSCSHSPAARSIRISAARFRGQHPRGCGCRRRPGGRLRRRHRRGPEGIGSQRCGCAWRLTRKGVRKTDQRRALAVREEAFLHRRRHRCRRALLYRNRRQAWPRAWSSVHHRGLLSRRRPGQVHDRHVMTVRTPPLQHTRKPGGPSRVRLRARCRSGRSTRVTLRRRDPLIHGSSRRRPRGEVVGGWSERSGQCERVRGPTVPT